MDLIALERRICADLELKPYCLSKDTVAAATSIVKSVDRGSDRQMLLQALMRLACSEDNEHRTTFDLIADIVETSGEFSLSSERIRQFSLGKPIDRRDRDAMLHACFRAICILKIKGHPCVDYLPFKAIFANTKWLRAYCYLLSGNDPTVVARRNTMDSARTLFQWVAEADAVQTDDVERLLHSTLFPDGGATTYATSVRLHMQQGQISLGELEFSHLPAVEDGPDYIHVSTRAADAKARDPEALLSTGFVVPRRFGVYVFQQQLGGYGFNITALQNREVEQGQRSFLRALLLTLDRDEHHVPIIAKSVYLVGERGLKGYLPIAEFRSEMTRRGRASAVDDILRYLSSARDAVVTLPVAERGMIRARSWEQLRKCLDEAEISDLFEPPTIELTRPITGA